MQCKCNNKEKRKRTAKKQQTKRTISGLLLKQREIKLKEKNCDISNCGMHEIILHT